MPEKIVIRLLVIIFIGILLPIIVFIPARRRKITDPDLVYGERLIEIYHDYLVLPAYYFGPFGRKRIPLDRIDSLETVELNLRTGKYRIQGTGDFQTWYPQDLNRPRKDRAFIVRIKGKRMRVGFTVEDFGRVREIFEQKGLLKPVEKKA